MNNTTDYTEQTHSNNIATKNKTSPSRNRDQYSNNNNTEWLQLLDPIVLEQIKEDPNMANVQKKILTVVFWDISGFSALCEILKEHTHLVVAFLKEYFSEANRIVHKNNGILDKFIGDGVMAYFGFKNQRSNKSRDGSIDSVNAALELREFFQQIKGDWLKIWKIKVKQDINMDLKCGINTGPALVGLIPTGERDQFTTIGSAVNLASKLEGQAHDGQIIVSPYTKTRIQDLFEMTTVSIDKQIRGFEYLTEYFEVKGKKKD
jgi:class 3 adenylate cyclase